MIPSNNHIGKDHRHYKIFKSRSTKEKIGYIDFIGYEYLWRCRIYNKTKKQFIEEIIVKARTFNQVFIRLKNRFFIKKDESWVAKKVKKVTPINYFSRPSVFDLKIQKLKNQKLKNEKRRKYAEKCREEREKNKLG